jgi:hypothetical protein
MNPLRILGLSYKTGCYEKTSPRSVQKYEQKEHGERIPKMGKDGTGNGLKA